MKYKASLDRLAIIVSIIVTLLVTTILFIMVQHMSIMNQYTIQDMVIYSVGVVILGLFFFVLFSRPLQYTLTPQSLKIHRPLWNIEVPLQQIKSLQQANYNDLRHTYRLWGVWAIFGYFGYFYNRTLGKMKWWATQRKNFIILHMRKGPPLVITPNDIRLSKEIEKKKAFL